MSAHYSICWDCNLAVCKCPWSKNFEPIPGWDVEERKIKQSPGIFTETYFVKSCPLFKQDEIAEGTEQVSAEELGNLIGMNKRSVVREKQDYLINRSFKSGYYLTIKRDSRNRRIYFVRPITSTGKYISPEVAKLFNIRVGLLSKQPKVKIPGFEIFS